MTDTTKAEKCKENISKHVYLLEPVITQHIGEKASEWVYNVNQHLGTGRVHRLSNHTIPWTLKEEMRQKVSCLEQFRLESFGDKHSLH